MKTNATRLSALLAGLLLFSTPSYAISPLKFRSLLHRRPNMPLNMHVNVRLGGDSTAHTLLSARVDSGTFAQKIDHFDDQNANRFQQRFAIYNDYSGSSVSTAPVLYYLCGEWDCFENGDALTTVIPNGVAYDAQTLGATIVVLEHRYYGKSLPFETLTPENMKYLTYEQALEDFAEFERTIIEHDHLGTKWISVGGSYPGALSAFYRQKYPNLVVGALSSSGVVRSVASFEDYDRMVAQGLGSNCLQAVQAGTQQIEAAINQPDQLSSIKKLFQTSDDTDALDLLSIPSNAADYAVQYGYQETFCNDVLSEAPLQGLAKASINISNAEGLDASPPSVDLSQDSWLYQSCTQFGGFVVPYHDPALRVQSSLLDLNYQTKDCQALFGISTLPPVDQTNKKFYAPLLDSSTSQILYVNGSMDPYSTLSISHINGNDINPNTKTAMVAGGSHCIDFSRYLNDPSALAQEIADVQLRFQSLAREWLASGSL